MSITMTISAESPEEFRNILAGLLAGAAPLALAAGNVSAPAPTAAAPAPAVEQSSGSDAAGASPAASDSEIDAHGHPWNPDIHAGTKTKTKEGLWRLKVGATRPDPLPGFPVGAAAGDAADSSGSAGDAGTGSANAAPAASEDDEFAAFREAAAASDAAGAAAAANAPARSWTDADLSKLCNQAATKLGNPEPVKAEIAKFVPEGEVAHSRNVPADKREEFAQAVEKAAGITFEG